MLREPFPWSLPNRSPRRMLTIKGAASMQIILPSSILALALALGAAASASIQPQLKSAGSSLPLQLMTSSDSQAAGTRGTGCTWSDVPGAKWRMSMADDRAAVKIGGKLMILKPAEEARTCSPSPSTGGLRMAGC